MKGRFKKEFGFDRQGSRSLVVIDKSYLQAVTAQELRFYAKHRLIFAVTEVLQYEHFRKWDPRRFANLVKLKAVEKHLALLFALYVKTKNFHWHMSGPHVRDYHLLLDEQATQVFAMIDEIAERARKLGGTTIRSISDIARHQRLTDNNAEFVAPHDMLVELRGDNQELTRRVYGEPLSTVVDTHAVVNEAACADEEYNRTLLLSAASLNRDVTFQRK
jgi:DNA-binding ferritin-like protein